MSAPDPVDPGGPRALFVAAIACLAAIVFAVIIVASGLPLWWLLVAWPIACVVGVGAGRWATRGDDR